MTQKYRVRFTSIVRISISISNSIYVAEIQFREILSLLEQLSPIQYQQDGTADGVKSATDRSHWMPINSTVEK